MTIEQTLEQMSSAHVLEAAVLTLPKVIDAHDPQEALERVHTLSGLTEDERAEFDSLVRLASEEHADEVVDLMRAAMAGASEQKLIDPESAFDAVGRKQLVIAPDLVEIGLVLVIGYLAVVTKGRRSEDEKIVMKEDKNGTRTITIQRKTVYLNPFSPLVKLFNLILNSDGLDEEK